MSLIAKMLRDPRNKWWRYPAVLPRMLLGFLVVLPLQIIATWAGKGEEWATKVMERLPALYDGDGK